MAASHSGYRHIGHKPNAGTQNVQRTLRGKPRVTGAATPPAPSRKGDLYIRGASPDAVRILKESAAIRRRTVNEELHARVMFVQGVRGLTDPGHSQSGTLDQNIKALLRQYNLGPLTV